MIVSSLNTFLNYVKSECSEREGREGQRDGGREREKEIKNKGKKKEREGGRKKEQTIHICIWTNILWNVSEPR